MLTRRQKHAEVAASSFVQANGVWGALPTDVMLQILDAVVALLAALRQQADPFALKVRQIGSAMRQCAVGTNAQPCTHQGCLPAETGFCILQPCNRLLHRASTWPRSCLSAAHGKNRWSHTLHSSGAARHERLAGS